MPSSCNIPDFSIITAHHGLGDASDPLLRSMASVTAQEGVTSEHVLQHVSGVTGLWNRLSRELELSKCASHYSLRLLEEKNSNFYDMLHRSVARATGTIIGFLQPGEEYLPNALTAVEKKFKDHPEIDVLMTGYVITDEKNKKKVAHPATPWSLEYFWTCCPTIVTSTLFFRASLLVEGFDFNPKDETMAFQEWFLKIMLSRKKIGCLELMTSSIPNTTQKKCLHRQRSFQHPAPVIMRLLHPWWRLRQRLAQKRN